MSHYDSQLHFSQQVAQLHFPLEMMIVSDRSAFHFIMYNFVYLVGSFLTGCATRLTLKGVVLLELEMKHTFRLIRCFIFKAAVKIYFTRLA